MPNPQVLSFRADAPAQQAAGIAPFDLGRRVRELRRERGWSLEAASDRTGLSTSSLFKIEKGKMSPTFEALKKLSQGFAIEVAQLLTARGDSRAASRRSITRKGAGGAHQTTHYSYKPLAAELAHKAFLPFELVLHARSLDEFDDWDRHDTEDFMYVLSGSVILYTEFYEPVRLRPGDSVYYDCQMGHACVSEGDDDAVVLWVSSR